MKSKIAGVALAAVMACGLGGKAEAATLIELSGSLIGQIVTPYTAQIKIDGTKSTVHFDTAGYEQYIPAEGVFDYSNKDGIVSLSFGGVYFTGNTDFDFLPSDISFYSSKLEFQSLVGTDANGLVSGSFTSDQIDVKLFYFNYFVDFPDGFSLAESDIATISSLSISQVPLPASLVLFGSSLLALGGIGYASRRDRVKLV